MTDNLFPVKGFPEPARGLPLCCLALLAVVTAVAAPLRRDYREETGPVSNPGQGWSVLRADYGRYKDLLCVGAVYTRYNWSRLEPEDGRFDWNPLEADLAFAAREGIPAAMRVMCANSGASGPVTPEWVWTAGAPCHVWESVDYSGRIVTNRSPVFESPVFQRLHRRFLTALAAKYDGDPRFLGIDLGSYGNWGEWHCGKLPPAVPAELAPEIRAAAASVRPGSREGYELYLRSHATGRRGRAERLTREQMKPYVDMYLDNFRKTDIVFMTDGAEVLDYALGDGPAPRVGLRRDGIGLEGHFKRWIGSPAYAHVPRMGDVWRTKPVWFEGAMDCNRILASGKGLFDLSVSFMLSNHVSLVNSFPFRPEQVKDDPRHNALIRLVNLHAGARLVPVSSTVERHDGWLDVALAGENKGVAKIYPDYVATVEARDAGGRVLHAVDLTTDVRGWLPGPFALCERAVWPESLPADAQPFLRLRSRAGALRDFRFATPDTAQDGALPLGATPSSRTPAAEAVLKSLRTAAATGSFYYAWCHPWSERDPAFRVETAGGPRPKAVADVDLSKVFGRADIGRTPCLYFTDFCFVTDETRPEETVAASRASLTAMVRAAWARHRSVPVFSWHPENPYAPPGWKDPRYGAAPYRYRHASEGYPQDHRYVFAEILRGEQIPRAWYDRSLARIAAFLGDLKDEAGEPIPAIVRLFHECEDDWAWWGCGSVSAADYRALFRHTVGSLRTLTGGGANLLFAYSPDRYWKTLGNPSSAADFLYRYPGDDVVDIVGNDDYSLGAEKDPGRCERALQASIGRFRLVSAFASARGKAAGLFETGVKGARDDAYDHIYRAMTAPGVKYGFLCTWGGDYSRPGTEEGRACWRRFAGKRNVLTVESGAGLVDPAR